MSCSIILGVRLLKNQPQRLEIDNVDLDKEVAILKKTASQKLNKETKDLEFIYAGMIMDDTVTLATYGIKPGVTIFVQEKVLRKQYPFKPINEKELDQMITSFEHLIYRNSVHANSSVQFLRPIKPEIIDKVIILTPSLQEDPAAVALLNDVDLLNYFEDKKTMKRTIQTHPALFEALQHFLSLIKDGGGLDSAQATTSSGYSYSLDALSDDDDDMEPNEQRAMNPLQRNTSYSAITAAQLAAAIANATSNFSSTGAVIGNSSGNNSGTSGAIITNEMFGNALQQAFAASPGINNAAPTFPTAGSSTSNDCEESMESIRTRLEPQLRQMGEMGLMNEGLNLRALQATSGDVQAAVELVFNRVID